MVQPPERNDESKSLILLLTGLLPCLTSGVTGGGRPAGQEEFARYEAMLKRSPFAVATADASAGATPDFAKDLYVANAAHSTEGDFVTLASTTDKNLKEYLSTKETVHGYSISNIQWSDQVGETKVTITKDGQFATLTFNEALAQPGDPKSSRPRWSQPPQAGSQVDRCLSAAECQASRRQFSDQCRCRRFPHAAPADASR